MNIVGTGLSGLVGSRIVELLSDVYSFSNLSLETGVDITDKQTVSDRIANSDAPWVFHFAAYTNVQQAEKERLLKEQSTAWKVNVIATEHIVETCKALGKSVLYIDTDYAFDGTKTSYSEDDIPSPLGWYAITKTEGAKRVLSMGKSGLVIRIANPYRAHPVGKKDFVHKIIEKFQNHETVYAANDQIFTPTYIDDLSIAIQALLTNKSNGVYHVVSSQSISPYAAAIAIAQVYGFDTTLVEKKTFAEMFRDKAAAPQFAYLTQKKLEQLGIRTHSFMEGVSLVKDREEGMATA